MGKRFGGKKQIKTFFDRPLFLFTMQPFINSDLINEIILVISDVDYNQFHEDIKLLGLSKKEILCSHIILLIINK